MAPTGTQQTRLVVLRGNSGSGKSSTSMELRAQLGRGVAWVEQDYLRRIVLREHDVPNGVNLGLIDQTVRYALDHEYHVILDGILNAGPYGAMLESLFCDHAGMTDARAVEGVDGAVDGAVDKPEDLGVTRTALWTVANSQKNHEERCVLGLRAAADRTRNISSPVFWRQGLHQVRFSGREAVDRVGEDWQASARRCRPRHQC